MLNLIFKIAFIFICSSLYSQDIVKIKTYYGNNNFHLPACIIETSTKLNLQKLDNLNKKTFERLPKQRGSVCTILKYKNKPYAIMYSEKKDDKLYRDTIMVFDNFKIKYENLIKRLEVKKVNNDLESHTVYGYYAHLGTCSHQFDAGYLIIISKNKDGKFFISEFIGDQFDIRMHPISKTSKGFEKEYEVIRFNVPASTAKENLYEVNGDLIVKDLYYVNENDEKYVYYLLKIQ